MQHSAVRVNTRCLRRSVRPCGALSLPGGRRGCGDLGLHSPPGSDATMMQLIPLRGPHHRCTCWHRDAPWEQPVASGASSPGAATGARPAPQLRGTRRTSASLAAPRARPGNQPLWLHVMHPAPGDRCRRGRQLARQPRGTPTGRCAADGAATHRSRRPADAPGLDLRHGWADPYRQPPSSGVASRRPAPAEVFSMVRNPLPTS